MKEETGFDFEFYRSKEETPVSKIVIPDGESRYDLEELKTIVEGYAKELGIHEYGSYVVYTTGCFDNRLRFKVN